MNKSSIVNGTMKFEDDNDCCNINDNNGNRQKKQIKNSNCKKQIKNDDDTLLQQQPQPNEIETKSGTIKNQQRQSINKPLPRKRRRRKRLYSTAKTSKLKIKIENNDEEESENIPIIKENDESKLMNSRRVIKIVKCDDNNNNNNNCDKKKSNRLTKKNNQQTAQAANVITNYFPIVSRRLMAAKLNQEAFNQRIIDCISKQIDPIDYLAVTEFPSKGKAIIARLPIRKGSFICEYSGDLIDINLAKKRELQYAQNQEGCYMYYFNWQQTIWCVDATKPTNRYGRLINHSRKSPNCKTKIFEYNKRPHLIFIALRDIEINEEILYDYGERDPMAIKSHPWLTTT